MRFSRGCSLLLLASAVFIPNLVSAKTITQVAPLSVSGATNNPLRSEFSISTIDGRIALGNFADSKDGGFFGFMKFDPSIGRLKSATLSFSFFETGDREIRDVELLGSWECSVFGTPSQLCKQYAAGIKQSLFSASVELLDGSLITFAQAVGATSPVSFADFLPTSTSGTFGLVESQISPKNSLSALLKKTKTNSKITYHRHQDSHLAMFVGDNELHFPVIVSFFMESMFLKCNSGGAKIRRCRYSSEIRADSAGLEAVLVYNYDETPPKVSLLGSITFFVPSFLSLMLLGRLRRKLT